VPNGVLSNAQLRIAGEELGSILRVQRGPEGLIPVGVRAMASAELNESSPRERGVT